MTTATTPGPWTSTMTIYSADARYYTDVTANGLLVATVYGDSHAEVQANVQLLLSISKSLTRAATIKQQTPRPQVGVSLRVLVKNPSDAPLKIGDTVKVIEDPDNGSYPDEEVLFVKDAKGDIWGLDPYGNMTEWELV